MQRQNVDQRHDIVGDCCFQQWNNHQQTPSVSSPMQQMEGKKIKIFGFSTKMYTIKGIIGNFKKKLRSYIIF